MNLYIAKEKLKGRNNKDKSNKMMYSNNMLFVLIYKEHPENKRKTIDDQKSQEILRE